MLFHLLVILIDPWRRPRGTINPAHAVGAADWAPEDPTRMVDNRLIPPGGHTSADIPPENSVAPTLVALQYYLKEKCLNRKLTVGFRSILTTQAFQWLDRNAITDPRRRYLLVAAAIPAAMTPDIHQVRSNEHLETQRVASFIAAHNRAWANRATTFLDTVQDRSWFDTLFGTDFVDCLRRTVWAWCRPPRALPLE